MAKLIAKTTFLNAFICPRLGWLTHNNQLPEIVSEDIKLRRLEGNMITEKARLLYDSGVLIPGAMQEAVAATGKALHTNHILFEAAFSADGLGARADVIYKDSKGWHLREVKSGKDVKPEYVEDAAYTFAVMTRAGIKVNSISLLLVSGEYRKGMPVKDLFIEEDITSEAKEKADIFNAEADRLSELLNLDISPKPQLILECKNCPVFEACSGQGISNHIFDIPRISEKLFKELSEHSVYQIDHIPPGIKLSDTQKRVWQSVCAKKSFVSPQLNQEINSIIWPAWYLDFETCATALPIYDEIGPYEKIVTQYSIHQCSAPGTEIAHFEYLADPSHDCRRTIAENLVFILKGKGSIIVYSSYEKGIISGLAKIFPDLSDPLNNIIARLFDLCALLRSHYYHPGFCGSYSIKKVLPVMVAELDYSDLEIKEGGSAAALFAFMAMGLIEKPTEKEKIRRNLLAYCKRDTLAMVKLHEAILQAK